MEWIFTVLQVGPFQVAQSEKHKVKVKPRLNLHGIVSIESASVSMKKYGCYWCCWMQIWSTFCIFVTLFSLIPLLQLIEDEINDPVSRDTNHTDMDVDHEPASNTRSDIAHSESVSPLIIRLSSYLHFIIILVSCI